MPVIGESNDHRGSRRQLWFGLLGIGVVAVVIGAAGLFAVLPIGMRTYSALVPEAQGIAIGDEVRVAGLPVGEVTALDLEPDHVRMSFQVDDEVFVGRDSSLQVRMLTVVGGHYVALTSAGAEPLGDEAIPADRVQLPYSLAQVFQDAVAPVRGVDGDALRQSLTQAGTALEAAPDSVRQMLAGVQSFVEVLDHQNTQISQTLALVDEYAGALEQTKAQLGRFVISVNQLETVVLDKQAEMRAAGAMTVSVVQRLAGVEGTYQATLKPLIPGLMQFGSEVEGLAERLDVALAAVRDLLARATGLLSAGGVTVDHSGYEVVAPQLCVPVPGKDC